MRHKILRLILFIITGIFIASFIFSGCSVARAVEEGAEQVREDATSEEIIMAEETKAFQPSSMEEEIMLSEEAAPMEEGGDYTSDLPGLDRKIIKNAFIELEIETGKLEEILSKISSLAEQNGGFVSNTQSYSDEEGKLTSGRITIRVPQQKFSPVVDKVKSYGTVKNTNISGQDVTEEYVDLESRLKNLEAQEEVLLELMEKSRTVKDSIEVQRELSNVQEEIEVIKGRMNYLDNMVSFSTIEIFLTEPQPITTTGWGFADAVKRGLRGAVRVLNGLVSFIILISPLIALGVIIWLIVWAIMRRRRRRTEKGSK